MKIDNDFSFKSIKRKIDREKVIERKRGRERKGERERKREKERKGRGTLLLLVRDSTQFLLQHFMLTGMKFILFVVFSYKV